MFDPTTHNLIDLSIGLEPNVDSEPWPPEIEYLDHEEGAELLAERLQDIGYDVQAEEFPEGNGLAWEEINAMTHTGTHMDAPWHYGPTTDGDPSMTVEEIPLEWTMGRAVVLDFTWKEPKSEITPEEVDDQLDDINHDLSDGEIVIIETGADELWGTAEYLTEFPGIGAAAIKHLTKKGVHVIGTDAYGIDKPFTEMGTRFVENRDNSELWPAHFAGREVSYCQIEKMANLDTLPTRAGFSLVTQPIKIQAASAGWVRPVAFVDQ